MAHRRSIVNGPRHPPRGGVNRLICDSRAQVFLLGLRFIKGKFDLKVKADGARISPSEPPQDMRTQDRAHRRAKSSKAHRDLRGFTRQSSGMPQLEGAARWKKSSQRDGRVIVDRTGIAPVSAAIVADNVGEFSVFFPRVMCRRVIRRIRKDLSPTVAPCRNLSKDAAGNPPTVPPISMLRGCLRYRRSISQGCRLKFITRWAARMTDRDPLLASA